MGPTLTALCPLAAETGPPSVYATKGSPGLDRPSCRASVELSDSRATSPRSLRCAHSCTSQMPAAAQQLQREPSSLATALTTGPAPRALGPRAPPAALTGPPCSWALSKPAPDCRLPPESSWPPTLGSRSPARGRAIVVGPAECREEAGVPRAAPVEGSPMHQPLDGCQPPPEGCDLQPLTADGVHVEQRG